MAQGWGLILYGFPLMRFWAMIFLSPMEGVEVFEMQPTHRVSRSRRNKRRSHHKIARPHTVLCPVTGQPKLPHAACTSSGFVRPGLSIRTKNAD
jgi:large subunit ribosomal protein L32